MEISKEQQKISMLDALGNDYLNICLVNVKNETARLVKTAHSPMSDASQERQPELPYYEMCLQSIEKYTKEPEKSRLKEEIRLENVREKMGDSPEYSMFYEVVIDGETHEFQLKFLRMDDPDYLLIGFRMNDSMLERQKKKLKEANILAEKSTRKAQEEVRKAEETIAKTAMELRRERMFLDVLCKDYTSVYYLDLETGTGEVLKIDESANAAKMEGLKPRKTLDYAKEMEYYCEHFVAEADQDFFQRTMTRENIKRRLSLAERFIFRYQSRPNKLGYQYFETQIARVSQKEFDNSAILAFRRIDDIVTAEQKYQKELERTNEILRAIGKIYYAIFQVDLVHDVYEEISGDNTVFRETGKQGCASKEMTSICKTFVVPEYQERILKFFDLHTLPERLRGEETIAEEYLAQDGNWHTARFVVQHRDAQGTVTNVLYVTEVISEAKRKEQNWIAIAEEANRANAAKTDFLRHMSHDIRTPINGIIGMIEIADRHRDDVQKLRECREKTLGAMEYLLSLVNNVLDIGKLETEEIVLEEKPFDLIPLLLKQLPVIEMQANENGINYSGGREFSTIRHRYLIGSPVHLNRVLMNLAGNAIRYNKRGGSVKVYCTEISSDEKTAVYQFVCSDTGIGMSEEFQKKAFDPYTQEKKGHVTSYNGSGLGLSIVKKIVEKMQGTIELQSKEGVGTTFVVTIPFKIDHDEQTREKDGVTEQTVDVTGKRALLVEDNELNREIAELILEEEGLVVTNAENGQEALDKFTASKEGWYDYIFMDIMMPVMDGLEATRRIRSMERPDAKTVPIFAMTANAFLEDVRESEEAGMDAHLTKPLEPEKIRKAIQEFAEKPAGANAAKKNGERRIDKRKALE